MSACVRRLCSVGTAPRFSQQGKAKHSKIKDHYRKLPSEAQKNKLKADVMKEVVRDMGVSAASSRQSSSSRRGYRALLGPVVGRRPVLCLRGGGRVSSGIIPSRSGGSQQGVFLMPTMMG